MKKILVAAPTLALLAGLAFAQPQAPQAGQSASPTPGSGAASGADQKPGKKHMKKAMVKKHKKGKGDAKESEKENGKAGGAANEAGKTPTDSAPKN